jgi:hypothetical protein
MLSASIECILNHVLKLSQYFFRPTTTFTPFVFAVVLGVRCVLKKGH